MSNYANLKSAIQSVIKTNGNNEITGQLLQTELLAMITTLGYGYQFMGIASPETVPGTPDAKVFYIAYTPGTYTNFNGISVTGLCVLKYATGWVKEDIPVTGGGGTDFTVETTDLTLLSGDPNKLKFADRLRESNITTGKNYIIVRETGTLSGQLSVANAIYEIRYDFDLSNGSVEIPANSILLFNGGKIKNATITGNDTAIIAGNYKIFDNVIFAGTFNGNLNACWVGAVPNDSTFDNSPILQKWFDDHCEFFNNIEWPQANYYFGTAVTLSTDKRDKHIYGCNSTFYVNIATDDAVFITLNVGENFSLRDVRIINNRKTGVYSISKTTALHLIKTHQFALQGLYISNFDRGVHLTDVWYGQFYGKNSFWQNRIAIFIDVATSQEVNTVDIHNVRVSGCSLDAAKALYPQESGESENDWQLRYGRCGVDVHSATYAVKYYGMVIEGVDFGIRYNYRARSSQATIDSIINIENCYFEGNVVNDIYIGKGYVINPNNYSYYYAISGGRVNIISCVFHTSLERNIFIKDCYALIRECGEATFQPVQEYGRSISDVDQSISPKLGTPATIVRKIGTMLGYPSNVGNVYPATIRQTAGNLRSLDKASGLLTGTGTLNIDTVIYTANGTGVARYIPKLNSFFDAPTVRVHAGIKPFELSLIDNVFYVKIKSGNGFVDVRSYGSQYLTAIYSLRDDGIEITEFIRRWKAGTAYTGFVNQVFPFKVRSVPSEGKLYMENYQGVESLIGIGKVAIDAGFSFTQGYYIFVEALCFIFYAYSSPRVVSDFVQCGRSYFEFGITGSSTAQFNKFRFVCTETQRNALRPRFNAIVYNTTSKKVEIYNGIEWVELTDPFARFVYSESGKSIAERAAAPDAPGQTFFNYATGITYKYAILSADRYTGQWFGDIGQILSLDHPNGYDATDNPVDYATELTAGEMVRYNNNIIKWDGTQFVNLDDTPIS